MMKKIIVGSQSPIKLEAVRETVLELGILVDVVGVNVSSGVNVQPYGYDEIMRGAQNRAAVALGVHGDQDTAATIGIENGVVERGNKYFDVAAIEYLSP